MSAGLFSRFGVELEYMVVDAATLDVRPIADAVLRTPEGAIAGEIDRGALAWSNELVAHVVELKVAEPAGSLETLADRFQHDVREINALLAPAGARLMPAGMHPWMDPVRETRLWAHEYNDVYAAFDRIFGSQGHGWSNLQSVHLNLPFANDEEFGRLHAAIRIVLPILPALAASSPVVERRATGFLDNRLEVYRTNSRKIPSITGRVIPEPVYTQADYEREILEQLYADIAPHDPEGTLQDEWLNARGAIARFQRNTIEIRVLDVQECPLADLAICAAVVAVLRLLISERTCPLALQQAVPVEPLERILLATVRDAELAVIDDADYLGLFGLSTTKSTAGALWRQLVETALREKMLEAGWRDPLRIILEDGPLARRILRALSTGSAGGGTSNRPAIAPRDVPMDQLRSVYRELCGCLAEGTMFCPEAARE